MMASTHVTARRAAAGAVDGLVATVVMTALMLGAVAAGTSPMPKPIPVALVAHIFGPLPKAVMMGGGMAAHLAYGTAAAVLVTAAIGRVTVAIGLGYGVLLWLVMGLVWLPYLGWGLFGTGQAPPIAVATLVLHLVYGAVLGGLCTWRRRAVRRSQATVAATDHDGHPR